jgi:ribosome-associated protein
MKDDLQVTPTIAIPRDELVMRATRSGGAGGQHVNTSATRVELLWSPARSRALSEDERSRIIERLTSRLDTEGFVRVVSSETRSQTQNRVLAEARLADLVRRALVVRKRRKKTRPSVAAREERLREKKQKSKRKSERRTREWD